MKWCTPRLYFQQPCNRIAKFWQGTSRITFTLTRRIIAEILGTRPTWVIRPAVQRELCMGSGQLHTRWEIHNQYGKLDGAGRGHSEKNRSRSPILFFAVGVAVDLGCATLFKWRAWPWEGWAWSHNGGFEGAHFRMKVSYCAKILGLYKFNPRRKQLKNIGVLEQAIHLWKNGSIGKEALARVDYNIPSRPRRNNPLFTNVIVTFLRLSWRKKLSLLQSVKSDFTQCFVQSNRTLAR